MGEKAKSVMNRPMEQEFVGFRRFALGVCVFLMMMGSADVVLAQHGGGREAVALSYPAWHAPAQDRAADRLAARRRVAPRRAAPRRSAAGVANEQDSLALVALFNVTGGASWTDSTNWLSGPVSTWFGITVDDEGRVNAVDLRGNNLSGTIPAALADLTEIDTLWLADNRLTGSIPAELATLAELTSLSLWGNTLTGPLPPELGQLANLKDL